jgi:hypothetical protein
MEPLEKALRTYLELSPIAYLQSTHDSCIHDIAFDGNTLVLQSEAWVGTDPNPPVPNRNFRVIFSRYRVEFRDVRDLSLETTDRDRSIPDPLAQSIPERNPGPPTFADFVQEEIRDFDVALPLVVIRTDSIELRFACRSLEIERFAPVKDDYR